MALRNIDLDVSLWDATLGAASKLTIRAKAINPRWAAHFGVSMIAKKPDKGYGVTLTHRATGYAAVSGLRSFAVAERCAKALDRAYSAKRWTFTTPDGAKKMPKAKAIIDRFQRRQGSLMAIGYGTVAPKGETRKKSKGRKDRAEAKVAKAVRAACVERDGYCRIGKDWETFHLCSGHSQWAHAKGFKRAHTRGMEPERRHTTRGSFQACEYHHALYDASELHAKVKTALGMNGPVEWSMK